MKEALIVMVVEVARTGDAWDTGTVRDGTASARAARGSFQPARP
jgi:hypothetical protein